MVVPHSGKVPLVLAVSECAQPTQSLFDALRCLSDGRHTSQITVVTTGIVRMHMKPKSQARGIKPYR